MNFEVKRHILYQDGKQVISKGYCQCGCGQKTNLAASSRKNKGIIKGEPLQYLRGHMLKGNSLYRYKGNNIHKYHQVNKNTEHREIANYMLNGLLDRHPEYVVHHKDENSKNNSPSNLVILKNISAHSKLHRNIKAMQECGNELQRKCLFCHKYDDTKNMTYHIAGGHFHKSCRAKYAREFRAKRNKSK